jgi:hypothetical protein
MDCPGGLGKQTAQKNGWYGHAFAAVNAVLPITPSAGSLAPKTSF